MSGLGSRDLGGFHRARVDPHVWSMGSRASMEFFTARDAINALEAAPAASSAALSGSSTKAPGFAGGYLLSIRLPETGDTPSSGNIGSFMAGAARLKLHESASTTRFYAKLAV